MPKATIAGCVCDAFTDMESLRDELNDWLENMPENLKGGQKADELETAISTIEEELDEPDVPVLIQEREVLIGVSPKRGGRAARRDTATGVLRVIIANLEKGLKTTPDEEIKYFRDRLGEIADTWDTVEFPGAR